MYTLYIEVDGVNKFDASKRTRYLRKRISPSYIHMGAVDDQVNSPYFICAWAEDPQGKRLWTRTRRVM